MKTLTMLAIVAVVAAVVGIASVPFSTISVSAASGHCHLNSGSFACNPGSFPIGGLTATDMHAMTYLITSSYQQETKA